MRKPRYNELYEITTSYQLLYLCTSIVGASSRFTTHVFICRCISWTLKLDKCTIRTVCTYATLLKNTKNPDFCACINKPTVWFLLTPAEIICSSIQYWLFWQAVCLQDLRCYPEPDIFSWRCHGLEIHSTTEQQILPTGVR